MKKRLEIRHYYLLPINEEIRKLYDDSCFEILSLWRAKTGKQNIEVVPKEIEALCDANFLLKSGAISCELVDYHPSVKGDALIFSISADGIRGH